MNDSNLVGSGTEADPLAALTLTLLDFLESEIPNDLFVL